MSTYVGVGSRRATGEKDTTGNNTGNWTVIFAPEDLNVNLPFFEVYKIVIHGAANSTFDVFVGNYEWDTAVRGDINSWDPNIPLQMGPGTYLYFYWSDPVTDNTPPSVTIWLRYDQDITANQRSTI